MEEVKYNECDHKKFVADKDKIKIKGSVEVLAVYDDVAEKNIKTNGDVIRSMSDEEMGQWIYDGISSDACDYCKHNDYNCNGSPCRGKAHTEVIVEWLQQPAEECK